jgi:hypothetical protein
VDVPRRSLNFENEKFYHIFDKGKSDAVVFREKEDYIRALKTLAFYQFYSPDIKLSRLLSMTNESQSEYFEKLKERADRLVEIISFCLVPKSLNLLLLQKKEGGISSFLSQFLNSYTRYFNSKSKRKGPLFIDSFKAKPVEAEKLSLVSRHIHLKPFRQSVVSDISELSDYSWSSFWEFTHPEYGALSRKEYILALFDGKEGKYKEFVENVEDYKNSVSEIKNFVFK